MAKKYLDKYYTPNNVVKAVIKVVEKEIKPLNEFDRIIEPSAGAGAFLKELPSSAIGYDIAPEMDGIIRGDYLTQEIEKKNNTLVIGNPPFATGGTLIKKFIKKSLEHSQWVAFVLPGDWHNRTLPHNENITLYKSYLLPNAKYSGVDLKCCFNIYTRGAETKKEIKGVKLEMFERAKETTQKEEDEWIKKECDYRIISFGTPKLLNKNDFCRCHEMKITFDKKRNFKPVLESYLRYKNKKTIGRVTIKQKEIKELIWDTCEDLRITNKD